jgi:hypothetical protein
MPNVYLSWGSRGENADPSRRAELRRLEKAQIAVDAQTARLHVTAWENTVLSRLASLSLSGEEARAIAADIPTVEQLLPPLDVRAEVRRLVEEDRGKNSSWHQSRVLRQVHELLNGPDAGAEEDQA